MEGLFNAEAKLQSTQSKLDEALECLEFYADPEKWAEFISTDGSIFDEVDGDFMVAFNSDDSGLKARTTLQKLRGVKP